ncbi:MAG TPA: DUF1285 domain-containing protein [Dongiaceae bacterium]|jgi:hypothetical protein|nr:DUF1285 domain-containing protein [Dongiaceae bacterium]
MSASGYATPERKASWSNLETIPICGNRDMRIAADGAWYYRGSLIARPALVKLFSTILSRDRGGRYWLATPVERVEVEVEDAPFLAVELAVEDEGTTAQQIHFRTNVDEWVAVGEDHPLVFRRGIPYLRLSRDLEAKVNRPVYYELMALALRHEGMLWSKGVGYSVGSDRETP